MEIVLDQYEMRQAALAGVERKVNALVNGRREGRGNDPLEGWQRHIEGAMGELAVAKALGLYWNYGVEVFKGPDLQVGQLQIRTTPHHNGHLLLHPEDNPAHRFVLVTGLDGRYVVRGWILGKAGKLTRYWREPQAGRPCYMVPQAVLLPISTLVDLRAMNLTKGE